MATMEIVYAIGTGALLYFAWQAGLLDQAGQQLVQATSKKGQQQATTKGWARERRGGGGRAPPIEILQPRMRLTIT